jgi:imidazolonepropionase
MESVDLLVMHASELLSIRGPNKPRVRNQMKDLGCIKNGSLAIRDGLIVDVGRNLQYKAENVLDASGKLVIPGFVDPHTHVVFAGSRESELDLKLKGIPYLEILRRGGGIFYTVQQTRKASPAQLVQQSRKRLDTMMQHGTTTCEAKTGYGLDVETEIKQLKVQKRLAETHPIDLVSTFLGAHAIPKHITAQDYVHTILTDMLPKTKGLAQFCDVFCEKGVFTVPQAKKILEAGKQVGLLPKIHADELANTGGAALAATVGAISADHLLHASQAGLRAMAQKSIVGVLLPGTPFCLMMQRYAPARSMIDGGVPIALATDLNPNCWTENMQLIIQLACLKMQMTPAEAITAATFNAACAIGRQSTVGSLERGKQADVLILDCPNHQFLPYHFGVNLVETVIKKGQILKSP